MIEIEKAKNLLLQNIKAIDEMIEISVADACGYMLAKDIFSPYDLPHFRQSTVDGYGFKNANHQNTLEIVDTIKAGEISKTPLQENECVRIFTGAMVPESVDTIVMQEHVEKIDGQIKISKELSGYPNFIRKKGSQIGSGNKALGKGLRINPGSIGFLHAMGIKDISVFRKPKVTILTCGDELLPIGETYQEGKVYESNAYALKAAVEKEGAHILHLASAKDQLHELTATFLQQLENADVVLVSGGISVGDYDFVAEVFEHTGVEKIFHNILQKPGKPLFFGKKNNTSIFGLPGNPASTLCCFYEYVLPALRMMMQKDTLFLPIKNLPISHSVSKKKELGVFLKAYINQTQSEVQSLEGQDSFILRSFASANALIYVPSGIEKVEAGTQVEVHLLPEY